MSKNLLPIIISIFGPIWFRAGCLINNDDVATLLESRLLLRWRRLSAYYQDDQATENLNDGTIWGANAELCILFDNVAAIYSLQTGGDEKRGWSL